MVDMSLSAGSKRNSAARMASRRAGSRASPSPAAAASSAISVGSPEVPLSPSSLALLHAAIASAILASGGVR